MTSPRPLVHRFFLRWLDEARQRFTVPPRVARLTDRWIEVRFPGLFQGLGGIFNRWLGIDVFVEWNGDCWDLIADFNVVEQRTSKGYSCLLCPPEDRKLHSTREQLWVEHAFEPFLDWSNETLAPARWLALHGEPEHATWVELLRNEHEGTPNGMRLPLYAKNTEDKTLD